MTLELLQRIVCAAMLGGLIGLEREYRAKEAGFRTHFLVGLGAPIKPMPLTTCAAMREGSRRTSSVFTTSS